MAERTVIVLGGGIGGVVAARSLRRRLQASDRVVLVDRSPVHRFPPSYLWVMTGQRRPDQVQADLGRLRRKGIEVVRSEILAIDPEKRAVRTAEGDLNADRLVIALGAEPAFDTLPGFAEGALNVYDLEGLSAAGDALRGFGGGRVAVAVTRLPYKCPAAPHEAALLAEWMLRKAGVRERCEIDVYTPEPFPMPTAGPEMGEAVKGMLAERGIGFRAGVTTERVDTEELVFENGDRAGYDLLLGIPPHRSPQVARESGLAAESGFIPVGSGTLATKAEGVYAIGDVTAIPIAGGKFLPKAGVFAHAEAEVVARRIADEMAGRTPKATFDGHGSCFVEMGDGVAAYSTGAFYGEEGAEISLKRPGKRWHLAKIAFEKLWFRRWL